MMTHLGRCLGPDHLGDGGKVFAVASDRCENTKHEQLFLNAPTHPTPHAAGGAAMFDPLLPRTSGRLTLHGQELLVRGPARVHLGGGLRGRRRGG